LSPAFAFLEPEVRIGGDSPTAQQAACSGLRLSAKVSRFELHGNRGQIKIQEDHSPKITIQVRNFALSPLALSEARDLKTTKSTRVSGGIVSLEKL
jgi:F0F1-type ATP synthase epsilon subunit